MKPSPIYVITAISPDNQHRVFGYYYNKDEALKSIDENRCDIHESYYLYLVLEEILPGIHSISQSETWFCWNFETKHWDLGVKPDFLAGSICFAMG